MYIVDTSISPRRTMGSLHKDIPHGPLKSNAHGWEFEELLYAVDFQSQLMQRKVARNRNYWEPKVMGFKLK